MNKTKIILLSIGGVTAVGALVLAYMIWSAWDEKSECAQDYESACDSVSQLMSGVKAGEGEKVYPGPKSVRAIDENRKRYAEWTDDSTELASVGDKKFEPTSPASFKAQLVEDARRLSALPGSVAGKFVKQDFGFGFNSFIVGGALPKEEELPQLQREWNDVLLLLDTLAESGATAVEQVEVKRVAAPKEDKQAKGKKKAKASDTEARKPTATTVALQFDAPSEALVRVLNALTANSRFVVVDSLTFVRASDPIAEKLGGDAKKSDGAAARGSRRQRRGAAAQQTAEKPEDDKKHGVITDPQNAPDLKVAMQVSVYDFRTAEKAAATDDVKATEEQK